MSEQPKLGRREGAVYVLLRRKNRHGGNHGEEFVEAEDHLGRSVGSDRVPSPDDGGVYRLLEFASVETLDELERLREEFVQADRAAAKLSDTMSDLVDALPEGFREDRENSAEEQIRGLSAAYSRALRTMSQQRAELQRLRRAADHFDRMFLRLPCDGGAAGDLNDGRFGIDPWGSLKDFRKAFGLKPTISPEEYARNCGDIDKCQARGTTRAEGSDVQ